MEHVTIFATSEEAAGYDRFDHGDAQFVFERLAAAGPNKLVEGSVWAFVDWVLDDLSGLEMCRRLRADPRTRDAHITMVLDEDDPEDRRRAIKAGADDYAIGPLDRKAMLDRVLALYATEGRQSVPQVLDLGALQINVAGEQARWKGQQITLRPNEFRVLRFLAENPNRVLSRQELVDALGKAGDPGYLRTVDVWIKRLRFGLRSAGAGHLLRTVHSKGYVLDLP
ncbi:DNA-binding response regulator [Aurantiacibacter xanthus]|uniref:DNA-binding response regulator n=1 Tax=Aurantiacibacter xanthus TaxID=1784712 RepID=A0A3A1P6F4_9SPHN|nr:response regulator transcription factor [Aurantiacibacter xanthus]RIV88148.1 DNA-binding response regulator [Aurantiacibacter xanthus]